MEDKQLIKQILLETMDEFHDFCEQHDLTYYLVGGGLIGAIRHKGFIPWDDDLDVIMSKKDFDKLVKLHDEFEQPLKLNTYALDKNYFRCCAALINNKLLVDTGSYKNNITGVTIDILCLFPTFENEILVKSHYKAVKFCRSLMIIKGKLFLRDKYNKVVYTALDSTHHLMKKMPKGSLINFLNFFENIKKSKSSTFANLHGAWGFKEIISTEMLKDRQLYEFDGREYWSMTYENAHKWLTNVYGDYMILPPESERGYRHIEKIIKVDESL